MGATRKYAVIDPATGKIDRRIFSDQAIYDEEMEKDLRARLADDRAREPGARGRRLLPHLHGRGPGHPDPRRAGPAARAAEHVPPPRQPRGALRRRQRQTLHVLPITAGLIATTAALEHVPGEAEAYYDALDRPSLGLIEARVETYAGIVFATWAKDAPSLEAYLGDARWYLDTVFNRRDGGMQALGPDEMARAGQLEDDGRQLLGQLPRPDQPSLQRRGADPLPRPAAAVARGPVRQPQQACLRQRARDHVSRRG